MGYRDRDAFNAMTSALNATGAFAEVRIADSLDSASVGGALLPLAAVSPVSWTEAVDSTPSQAVRKVAFNVTVVARDDDPSQRLDTLDLLSSIVANAIDGSNLGGGCLAGLTRLGQGKFAPGKNRPEGQVTLSGFFSYAVGLVDGHDTTP